MKPEQFWVDSPLFWRIVLLSLHAVYWDCAPSALCVTKEFKSVECANCWVKPDHPADKSRLGPQLELADFTPHDAERSRARSACRAGFCASAIDSTSSSFHAGAVTGKVSVSCTESTVVGALTPICSKSRSFSTRCCVWARSSVTCDVPSATCAWRTSISVICPTAYRACARRRNSTSRATCC